MHEESYQEFVNRILNKGSHPHRLTHCLGTRDAWKWIRKNKWEALDGKPCDQLLYSKIINTVNKALVEQLLEGHEIEFPHQMGKLLISAVPTKLCYKNGILKTNYRIDWAKTLALWHSDKEALNSRKPIKRVTNEIYFIRYNKKGAKFHNRRYYQFRQNRSLGNALGKLIRDGIVNAEKQL